MSETLNLFTEQELDTPKSVKKLTKKRSHADEAKRLIIKMNFRTDNLRKNQTFRSLDLSLQNAIRYQLRKGFEAPEHKNPNPKTTTNKDKLKEIGQNLAPSGSIYSLITAIISIVIMLFLQEDSIEYFNQMGMSFDRARILVYLTEVFICLCSVSPMKRFRVIAYILVLLNAYTFCIKLYKNDEGRVNRTILLKEEKALLIQQKNKYETQIEFYQGNLTAANNQLGELTKKGFITKGNQLLGKKISNLKIKIDQSENLYNKTISDLKRNLKNSTSIGDSSEIGIETWILIGMRLALQCGSVMFLHIVPSFIGKFKFSRMFKESFKNDDLKNIVNFQKTSTAMS